MIADDMLHAWVDGTIDPEDRRTVEDAFAADPELRARAHAMRDARDLLRRVGPTPAPPGLTDAVLSRLDEAPDVPWWQTPWARRAEGALLAVAAGLVLWLAVPTAPPEAPPLRDTTIPASEGPPVRIGPGALTRVPTRATFSAREGAQAVLDVAATLGAAARVDDGAVHLEIPAARWPEAAARLRALGTLTEEGSQASNGQVDIEVRLEIP